MTIGEPSGPRLLTAVRAALEEQWVHMRLGHENCGVGVTWMQEDRGFVQWRRRATGDLYDLRVCPGAPPSPATLGALARMGFAPHQDERLAASGIWSPGGGSSVVETTDDDVVRVVVELVHLAGGGAVVDYDLISDGHARTGPVPYTDPAAFPWFADFRVEGGALGFGEGGIELEAPAANGSWRACYMGDDHVDGLVSGGVVDESELRGTQLLLVREDRDPVTVREVRVARRLGDVSIHGASFLVADASARDRLDALGAGDLFGAHGGFEGGWGLHLMLIGDGSATVWVEDVATPTFAFVEL